MRTRIQDALLMTKHRKHSGLFSQIKKERVRVILGTYKCSC